MPEFDIDSLMSHIKSLDWRRLLFLVVLLPLMFHIMGAVTLPDYTAVKIAPPSESSDKEPFEDKQLTEFQKLKSLPGFAKLGLDPEEMYIQSKKKEVIMNPLIKYLMEYSPGQLEYDIIRSVIKVEAYDGVVLSFFAYFAVLMLIAMIALFRTDHAWAVLPFAEAGLNIGGVLIFITVVSTPIFWFVFDYNLLGRMSGIFLKGPLYLFISSILSLKIYDSENPLYSRLITSLTSLTASAAIVYLF